MQLNKSNFILAIFLTVAILYLAWVLYACYFTKPTEHFVNETLDDYNARMTVMKIFDTVLHRKPLPEEIDKFAKFTNEQDMLVAVLTDYKIATPPPAGSVDQEVATAAAAIAPAPVAVAPVVVAPVVPTTTTTATAAAATTMPVAATTPPMIETLQPAPVPANDNTSHDSYSRKRKEQPPINLVQVEASLSSIMDSVNVIRASLYTQALCESEA